jgi:hypothetical protein
MQFIQVLENDLNKRRVYLHLVDGTDGITAKTGQTGTCKISVNGNAPTTSVNSIVEIDSTNMPGDYYVILDQKEIATAGVVIVRFKNSNTAEFVQIVSIIAFDPSLPISLQPGFNQAVAPDIDYKRIAKLLTDAISAIPKPVEPKEPDLEPIVSALHDLYSEIRAIHIPEPEKLDLSPLDAKFEAVLKAVKAVKMPDLDTKPVIDEVKAQAEQIMAEIEEAEDELGGKIDDFGRTATAELKKTAADLIKRPVQLTVSNAPEQAEQPGKPLKGPELLKEYLKNA